MKKIGIMAAIIIVNFIFQTSLYNYVKIFGVIPNISLIFVVIFAMTTNSIIGGFLGFLTGFLYDVMLYDVFGVYILIYFLIGSIIGSLSEEINRENYAIYSGITFLSTVFFHFCLYILLFFLKYRVDNAYYILGSIGIEIFLNAVISIVILKFIIYIFNKLNLK